MFKYNCTHETGRQGSRIKYMYTHMGSWRHSNYSSGSSIICTHTCTWEDGDIRVAIGVVGSSTCTHIWEDRGLTVAIGIKGQVHGIMRTW